MARRGHGKLVFLDLVDRSGRIQLLCDTSRTGPIDLDLGDIVGVAGPSREDAARRALARGRRARAAREDPRARCRTRSTALTDVEHALPPALPRPADERGDARATSLCRVAHGRGDPPLPRRARASSRSRRRSSSRATAARSPSRSSRTTTSSTRDFYLRIADRALPQAPDRRRARAGVRARQGLPQRGRLVQAQPRVHDARVVRGVRGLPRHDGADRGARRDGRAGDDRRHEGRRSAATTSTCAAVAAASSSSTRSRSTSSGRATRTSCAPRLEARGVDTSQDKTWAQLVDHASRTSSSRS